MTDALIGMFAGLGLGSGVIYFSYKAKENYTRHQRHSLISLGVILILGGVTRITVAEGIQEQVTNAYTSPIVRESFDQETNQSNTYQLSYLTSNELTEEILLDFYHTLVQSSTHDQVVLVSTDQRGFVFSKKTASFDYGTWKVQPKLEKILGSGVIKDHQITYQFH